MKDRQYLASVQEAQQRLIDKKMRKVIISCFVDIYFID